MNILRFLAATALVLLVSMAFVHAAPVEDAGKTALVSPATSSSGLTAAAPPPTSETGLSSSPAAHLTIGQVVFNFVSGMLSIVEDTIRGYIQFGPATP